MHLMNVQNYVLPSEKLNFLEKIVHAIFPIYFVLESFFPRLFYLDILIYYLRSLKILFARSCLIAATLNILAKDFY